MLARVPRIPLISLVIALAVAGAAGACTGSSSVGPAATSTPATAAASTEDDVRTAEPEPTVTLAPIATTGQAAPATPGVTATPLATPAPTAVATRTPAATSTAAPEATAPAPQSCDDGAAVPDPESNPDLVRECEWLLALRDPLAGSDTLDWHAGRPVADWEGVTIEGSPPRVTRLKLADRGLSGEVWGWIGNLTSLMELRLEGNSLTGSLPSKLTQLTDLTRLYLRGNALTGCIPIWLSEVANNDLALLGLTVCKAPEDVSFAYPVVLEGETYLWRMNSRTTPVVFDVPQGMRFEGLDVQLGGSGEHVLVFEHTDSDSWLAVGHDTGLEHRRFIDLSAAAPASDIASAFDRLAASLWFTRGFSPATLAVVWDGAPNSLILEWTGGPDHVAARWQYRRTNPGTARGGQWLPWEDIEEDAVEARSVRVTELRSDAAHGFELRALMGAVGGPPSETTLGAVVLSEGLPTLYAGMIAQGDGRTEWVIQRLDFVFTIPNGERLRVESVVHVSGVGDTAEIRHVGSRSLLRLGPDGAEIDRDVAPSAASSRSDEGAADLARRANEVFDALVASVRTRNE